MKIFLLSVLLVITGLTVNVPSAAAEKLFEKQLEIEGVQINVVFDDQVLWGNHSEIIKWVKRSAEVITNYFGRFPVRHLDIVIIGIDGDRVSNGWVFGGADPIINIRVGRDVRSKALKEDWVMVHEMAHLAFPDVKQRWIEEGLATYIESVARAKMGELPTEHVWREFIKRMPQGQPKPGDKGLDHTPTWGRTYWGGAIFCLVADVEIRRLTNNRLGLNDALRGLLDAGYSMNRRANLEEVLSAADKAVGVPVMTQLYNRHKSSAEPFELQKIWRELGIDLTLTSVKYLPDAPLKEIRQSILPEAS